MSELKNVLGTVAELRRLGVPEAALTPIVEWWQNATVWECGPHANAWNGHDARCRRVPNRHPRPGGVRREQVVSGQGAVRLTAGERKVLGLREGDCGCCVIVDSIGLAEFVAARVASALAPVEALADEWARSERTMGCLNAAHRLRAALTAALDHGPECMCPWCHSERLTYCLLTRGGGDHQDHRVPECEPPPSVSPGPCGDCETPFTLCGHRAAPVPPADETEPQAGAGGVGGGV